MSLLLDNGQPSGMTAPSPGNKTCRICASRVSGFKASPTEPGHTEKKRNRDGRISAVEVRQHGDDHRACGECWEAHLSLQVQEKHAAEVQCMFCSKVLTASEIGELSRKDSRELYDMKKTANEKYKCMARCKGQDTFLQARGNERVFTCEDCEFQVCLTCDLPEHHGETCEERQARLKQNQKELEDGFKRSEQYAEIKDEPIKGFCPNCDVPFTLEKGCGYTQCALGNKMKNAGITTGGCGHRFCSECLINWSGDASAYLGGKSQHGTVPGSGGKMCPYFTKTAGSTHGLHHRFQNYSEDELRATLPEELVDAFDQGRGVAKVKDRKKVERRQKFEAEKRAGEENSEGVVAKKARKGKN